MRLASGTFVGPYEILAPLGAGGMGEVYRARDSRLRREVALKVLPEAFTADAARLGRFEQEALAAAALQHPNLLAVYDVGQHQGSPYLVSELLAGETLRARLTRGPLPLREALAVGLQLARGLAAAHERGIVHRDLKPENVFLGAEGLAKILDFGLAKLTQTDPAEVAELPTRAGTEAGVVLGTPGYMAPEQARGLAADHRADVFAFGALLYEMLAGRRAFAGDTTADSLLAVLRDEPPDLAAARTDLPPGLLRVVGHCLEKDPRQRFQSMRDLAFDLEVLSTTDSGAATAAVAPIPAAPATRRGSWVAAMAGVGLVLAGLAWWGWSQRQAESPASGVSPTRLAVLPFAVRGGPDLAYLREGLVDLLSAKLDGAGELRTVDPHALLGVAGEHEDLDGARGREIAARFGAGLYLLGSLVEAGGRLQLAATLYQGEAALASVEAAGNGEADLLAMVDEIARQVVAGRFSSPAGRLNRAGALTTDSIPALKQYLAGEQDLRAGRMSAAAEAFERAVAADPDFALAHYRLAVAAGWADEGSSKQRTESRRALELSTELTERDQLLLRALDAYARGDAGVAEELYRDIVRRYPDEFEAWYGLGEVLIHHNAPRGRAKAEAEAEFRRVLELDPDFQPALYHLAQLMVLAGRPDQMQGPASRLLELYPESDNAARVRFWMTFLNGSEADREAVRLAVLAAPDRRHRGPIFSVLQFELRQLDEAWALAERVRNAPGFTEFDGYHRARLNTALARGQLALARAEFVALAGEGPMWAQVLDLPFLPVTRQDLETARAQLLAWQPPEKWDWEEHESQAKLLRTYALGMAGVRLGEATAVRQAEAELGRFSEPGDQPLVAALRATLRAHLLAPNDPQGALREIEGISLTVPSTLLNGSPFYNQLHARQLRAELLFRLERFEEAIAWFRSLDETCCLDNLLMAAYSHLRRGEAYDRLGKATEATWHYTQFVELWKDADPELQPQVERARQRLAQRQRL